MNRDIVRDDVAPDKRRDAATAEDDDDDDPTLAPARRTKEDKDKEAKFIIIIRIDWRMLYL